MFKWQISSCKDGYLYFMTIFKKINSYKPFSPPPNWLQIKTIDMHTGGEPLRVILNGFPEIKGSSVLDYRQCLKNNYDHLRQSLTWEPRGHADMYGCILTPPNDEQGDFGIVFMHNEGYSTMCGHAIIAISTLAIKMEWVNVREGENILKIDAPCGRITSFVQVKNNKVQGVKFHGVPSFVSALDLQIACPSWGRVTFDLAYGGAFYAYVDMKKNNFDFDLTPGNYRDLIKAGMEIKKSIKESRIEASHPFEEDLSFIYGTIFLTTDPGKMVSKNVCVFAEGEVDRCPTGSGVMGRLAIHHARNEIHAGQPLEVQSIVGSKFIGSVVSETDYGPFKAIIPQVEGTAYITGDHTFLIDPDDPLIQGFLLR